MEVGTAKRNNANGKALRECEPVGPPHHTDITHWAVGQASESDVHVNLCVKYSTHISVIQVIVRKNSISYNVFLKESIRKEQKMSKKMLKSQLISGSI